MEVSVHTPAAGARACNASALSDLSTLVLVVQSKGRTDWLRKQPHC